MKVRRSRFIFFRIEERRSVDIASLLAGDLRLKAESTVVLISLPDGGRRHNLDSADFNLLKSIPDGSWVSAEERTGGAGAGKCLERLIRWGALLSDREDPRSAEMRSADQALGEANWNEVAALFHLDCVGLHRSSEPKEAPRPFAEIVATSSSGYEQLVERSGPPLPALFQHPRSKVERTIALPEAASEGSLMGLLRKRRTVRSFRRDRPIGREVLSTLLQATFGCLGATSLAKNVDVLWRSSPSAGSLHPVEPYLLLRNVEGIGPSLHHYNAATRSLDQLQHFQESELESIMTRAADGQSFAQDASVVVVLVARYRRNTWKYRDNVRVPVVVATDVGHLSQTFYLMCAELGLACFYSGAIDASFVGEQLGLDWSCESAIGMLGCGWPLEEGNDLGLVRVPFDPVGP